jgi:NNP family nitrate/nitrite transporter-like MFS transporter
MESGPKLSPATAPSGNPYQLLLATGAFAVCFAIFGSISAMMPILRERLSLEPWQVSVAIATPVLLGSLGRIPLGILADRFGGRLVFSVVMFASVIALVPIALVESYGALLAVGFFVGLSLASFSVGVGFVSGWYPPERQGLAIGVYGAGNIGQSLAAFGAPVIAGFAGFVWGFWAFAAIAAVWAILFSLTARNPPTARVQKSFKQLFLPLRHRMSWVLSVYYFFTFGGFVAMSIYLPTFLTDIFGLKPSDAGLRTAGFVLFATFMRPVGGALADRLGGPRVLAIVFPTIAFLALFMTIEHIVPFTIAALGIAIAIGLGNGAVFKLVPQHFPTSVGSVTGLVGAAGGLGGFFPPLVVGGIREATGSYALGFVLLSLAALSCVILLWRTSGGKTPAGGSAATESSAT